MTPSLELHLEQLRDLILRVGPGPILTAPLVTPDDAWFPDRWSPDLESVRRILFRLAEYAGLSQLDIEVVAFWDIPAKAEIPEPLIEAHAQASFGAKLLGMHDGCAWFALHDNQLRMPQHLVGVLARGMARVWRSAHDVHLEPHQAEEECTDLTAIVLGFGIMTCNTAYEYRTAGGRAGMVRGVTWTHSVTGAIDVDDLSALLAFWARLKDLRSDAILKYLSATQADAFRKAWARGSDSELRERLGIPEADGDTPWIADGASEREFGPSRAAQRVHACVKRLVEICGEDGGLASGPQAFPARAIALPHRTLASWGRISASATWIRRLFLVSDPEWDTQAIVVWTQAGEESTRDAIGHVRDRQARDGHRLCELLKPAFLEGAPLSRFLCPGLPTFVDVVDGSHGFGLEQLEPLFLLIAGGEDPDQVARETAWLTAHKASTRKRLELERAPGWSLPAPSQERIDTKDWWRAITDFEHVRNDVAASPI